MSALLSRPPKVQQIIRQWAHVYGVRPEAILSPDRTRPVSRSRNRAVTELAHIGYTKSEIARFLMLHPSSVWSALKRTPTVESFAVDIPCPDLSGEWCI